jgi:hypothetical protein
VPGLNARLWISEELRHDIPVFFPGIGCESAKIKKRNTDKIYIILVDSISNITKDPAVWVKVI